MSTLDVIPLCRLDTPTHKSAGQLATLRHKSNNGLYWRISLISGRLTMVSEGTTRTWNWAVSFRTLLTTGSVFRTTSWTAFRSETSEKLLKIGLNRSFPNAIQLLCTTKRQQRNLCQQLWISHSNKSKTRSYSNLSCMSSPLTRLYPKAATACKQLQSISTNYPSTKVNYLQLQHHRSLNC